MPHNRDRHDRGLRGPLSVANDITGEPVPLRRRASSAEYFVSAVENAISRIRDSAPEVLRGVTIGIEEVPTLTESWGSEPVPLAAALDKTDKRPAQVVVYRRPLEFRAPSRPDLDALVHRTIVEQLAALTGLEATTIDPDYRDEP